MKIKGNKCTDSGCKNVKINNHRKNDMQRNELNDRKSL